MNISHVQLLSLHIYFSLSFLFLLPVYLLTFLPLSVRCLSQDFAHPAADRRLQFDLRHAPAVLAAFRRDVACPRQRARLDRAAARAWRIVERCAGMCARAVTLRSDSSSRISADQIVPTIAQIS